VFLPLVLIRDFARRRKKNGKFGDEVLPVEDDSSEFATQERRIRVRRRQIFKLNGTAFRNTADFYFPTLRLRVTLMSIFGG